MRLCLRIGLQVKKSPHFSDQIVDLVQQDDKQTGRQDDKQAGKQVDIRTQGS